MDNVTWTDVCQMNDLIDNSGVCVLVKGRQIAIFKIRSKEGEQVYATSNWDPIGNANVIYRGLIGSVDDAPVIASPLYKQRFNLLSGDCLDKDDARLEVYRVRIHDQLIQLSV